MQGGMFRKAALDKVSSPEQLDLLMQVTSPVGWLALVTVGAILVVVGVWSVVGAIPELVDGQGTLFRGERLSEVRATMAGTLLELAARPGAHVAAGQTIAVIRRKGGSNEDMAADEMTIAKNDQMAATKRSEIGNLRQQRAVQASLVNQGLKPGNVLLDWDARIIGAQGELNSLEQQSRSLRARMSATGEMKTPESGRVVEVLKSSGDIVGEGEAIMRIEPDTSAAATPQFCGGNTHVILYVPSRLAGKLRPRQEAHVSPLDVKKEEFGYLLGEVAWVARFPASPEDMREKLKNEELVRAFASSGPVYESRVCLQLDPANKANGYKWSSSTGPEKAIESGAGASASIVVDQRKPYTYIIPAVRRAVGL